MSVDESATPTVTMIFFYMSQGSYIFSNFKVNKNYPNFKAKGDFYEYFYMRTRLYDVDFRKNY